MLILKTFPHVLAATFSQQFCLSLTYHRTVIIVIMKIARTSTAHNATSQSSEGRCGQRTAFHCKVEAYLSVYVASLMTSLINRRRKYTRGGIGFTRFARNAYMRVSIRHTSGTPFYCGTDLDLSLLQVQATDPDCGVNAMVNYTLAGGRLESKQLLVRSDTGHICVRSRLDRETAPYLELPVIATDRGLCYFSVYCSAIKSPI